MRVIAGRFRSRQLYAPPGMQIRPTSDSLRETLFNVLGPQVSGSLFVDCYAGTGAVGIEALSRGARHVFFIERSARALAAIRKNLQLLGADSQASVFHLTAKEALRLLGDSLQRLGQACDFFFLDPPYQRVEDYGLLLHALAAHDQLISSNTVVIAEHKRQLTLAQAYGPLQEVRTIRQGSSVLTLFQLSSSARQTP